MNEKWMGTEEEEREAYVTELTYIHSKARPCRPSGMRMEMLSG